MAFAFPIKLSLSQFTTFHTFTLLILSPSRCGGSERAAVWCLIASWG